jgi:chemotaxis protein MotB
MAGHGGGAWKVAYADFVTAMMAFFMVMWLVAQKADVKQAIAQHFQDPFALHSSQTHGHSYQESRNSPHDKAKKKPPQPNEDEAARRARRMTVVVQGAGKHTSIGTIVYFGQNSAELDEAGQAKLDELLPELAGRPQKIEVRGHASRRPLPAGSPFHDPWQLAYARCQQALAYLEKHGIAPERMRLSQAGVYEPLGSDKGPEFLAQQERVEIRLLNEMVQDWLTPDESHAKNDEPAEPAADHHDGGHDSSHAAGGH